MKKNRQKQFLPLPIFKECCTLIIQLLNHNFA